MNKKLEEFNNKIEYNTEDSYIKNYDKKSKPKTTARSAPSKIYYIQNSSKRKKSAIKKPNIAIKGSVISEISEEEINAFINVPDRVIELQNVNIYMK